MAVFECERDYIVDHKSGVQQSGFVFDCVVPILHVFSDSHI